MYRYALAIHGSRTNNHGVPWTHVSCHFFGSGEKRTLAGGAKDGPSYEPERDRLHRIAPLPLIRRRRSVFGFVCGAVPSVGRWEIPNVRLRKSRNDVWRLFGHGTVVANPPNRHLNNGTTVNGMQLLRSETMKDPWDVVW